VAFDARDGFDGDGFCHNFFNSFQPRMDTDKHGLNIYFQMWF
jgi:hypothetical protein